MPNATRRQVTKDEFYDAIGPLDVGRHVHGRSTSDDYRIEMRRPNGSLVGVKVPKGPVPEYKPDADYFLVGA